MGVTKKLSALLLTAAIGTAAAAQGITPTDNPVPLASGKTPVGTNSLPSLSGVSIVGGGISFRAAPNIAPAAATTSIDFAACSGGGEAEFKACAENVVARRNYAEMTRIMGDYPRNLDNALKALETTLAEGANPANQNPQPKTSGLSSVSNALNLIAVPYKAPHPMSDLEKNFDRTSPPAPCYAGPLGCQDRPEKLNLGISRVKPSSETDQKPVIINRQP